MERFGFCFVFTLISHFTYVLSHRDLEAKKRTAFNMQKTNSNLSDLWGGFWYHGLILDYAIIHPAHMSQSDPTRT